MHEICVSKLNQLKKGVYVNGSGDAVCFLEQGNFLCLYYCGKYYMYTINCDYMIQLKSLQQENSSCMLIIDHSIHNYCDKSGNKIELTKKGMLYKLIINVDEEDYYAEIKRLSSLHIDIFLEQFIPVEFTDIVDSLAEKPIDIEVTSNSSKTNIILSISNLSTGNINEHLLMNNFISLKPFVRFIYDSTDEETENFLRRHNVPIKLRWPITAE